MKNLIKLFGIIAIVAVIGFSMAACDDGGGGKPSTFSKWPAEVAGQTWQRVGDTRNIKTITFVVVPGSNDMAHFSGGDNDEYDKLGDSFWTLKGTGEGGSYTLFKDASDNSYDDGTWLGVDFGSSETKTSVFISAVSWYGGSIFKPAP